MVHRHPLFTLHLLGVAALLAVLSFGMAGQAQMKIKPAPMPPGDSVYPMSF